MDEVTREAARAHRARARLASGYASRGWYVLPTRERRPIIKEWETRATADPLDARDAWFPRGDWTGCNIGIAPGPSGLVILDVDRKKGKDGFATLAKLGIELPDTYAVRTPSHGEHHYFAAPPGVEIRLSASQIGDGLDIRAWGGMIVAAGSEIDGVPYEVIRDVQPLALPDDLRGLIMQHAESRTRSKLAEKMPEVIPEGERESVLVSLAGSMRRRGASAGAILAALTEENTTRCMPPLADEDLQRIAGSVGRYAPEETPEKQSDLDTPIEVDQELLNRTLIGLETNRLAAEMMKTRAMRRQRLVLGGMDTPMNVLQWVNSGPDPTEVCIWGVPELGGVMGWAENQGVIIAGPPGTGKSTIALQVVLRRVGILGGDVLGMPVKVAKTPLTYMALDRADQIRQSVMRMIPEDADSEAIERLLVTDNIPPHVDLRQPETFITWLNDQGSEAVVMDSAKDLGFDLNDSSEGQAFNYLVQAVLRAKIQVLVLHHSRKVPRGDKKPLTLNDLHGSQWVAAGAGSVLMLDGVAGPEPKKLFHVKPLTVPMPPLRLSLDAETGEVSHEDHDEFDEDGDGGPVRRSSTTSVNRIVEYLHLETEPRNGEQIARDLGISSGTVSKGTRRLSAEGLIRRAGKGWELNREEVLS